MLKGEDFEECVRDLVKTKSFKATWNYYLHIIETEDFKAKIKGLRLKYEIPLGGYKGFKKGQGVPLELKWPKEVDEKTLVSFSNDIKQLCRDYNLPYGISWKMSLQQLLFYNDVSSVADWGGGQLTCMFTDLAVEAMEQISKETQKNDNKFFPLAIRFSPYTTQRQITEFIKALWPLIRHCQESYQDSRDKIGKYKTRDPERRKIYEFIYKHRSLPYQEISNKLGEKFKSGKCKELLADADIDIGHIGKIISLEKERRKKL